MFFQCISSSWRYTSATIHDITFHFHWLSHSLTCCKPTLTKTGNSVSWKLGFYFMLGTHHKIVGPISPLPTILGNVLVIFVLLKTILSDCPVVWGVLRLTESARKNVGGALIANWKCSTCWINPAVCVWGGGGEGGGWVEDTTHYRTKTVQSTIFGPHVCGLTHFENLLVCTQH